MKNIFFQKWGLAIMMFFGAAAILALNLPMINSAFKNTAYAALAQAQKKIWAAGADAGIFFNDKLTRRDLATENARLRAQAAGFLAQQAQIEALKRENDFLRQGLNLELEKDFDLKLANITGKIPARDIIIIDKGARDMIEAGMPVIDSNKAVAGKVVKTYDNFSEVRLITDKDFSFDVSIDSAAGLFRGLGVSSGEIDLVPKDQFLIAGQGIFTGGLGGIFPQGLLVGSVKELRINDVDAFRSATVELAFDVAAARQVFVAVDKKPLDLPLLLKINQSDDE